MSEKVTLDSSGYGDKIDASNLDKVLFSDDNLFSSPVVGTIDYEHELEWSTLGTQTFYIARPRTDSQVHYLIIEVELQAAPTDFVFDDFLYNTFSGREPDWTDANL